ncbi:ribonuclease R [Pararhodobacter sp. SW119]|uniref:ribonuclease R n=1 Tax=Pararhodobacter sp. SW119 TaxID=2780075 RepID=UPI001ADEC975|nr:ribonuclease R [Pararhodobacter sp. SW119]
MSRIPTKSELQDWLAENPGTTGLREIGRAFGLKGSARTELKRLLAEMEEEGLVERRKRRRGSDRLPPVGVLRILGPDAAGDLFAEPQNTDENGKAPRILMTTRTEDPALGAGDRVLAKLLPVRGEDHDYQARLIRKLDAGPRRILGIYRRGSDGGRIVPIDRGANLEWRVAAADAMDAKDGELIEAEQTGPARLGLPPARVVAVLGDPSAPRAVSLIAIHQHGIPDAFPEEVLAEAEAMEPAPLDTREDLRDLTLITIDPSDARDHDDAIFAARDKDPKNPGGFVVWVAIADVAHYVRPGSELDREARKRGNSTYFPDRVVPMLPERLSADLCSLHEGVDRAVLAVRMVLDAHGHKIAHRFTRGMMRSHATLHYAQAQAAFEGRHDDATGPLAEMLADLYAAWRSTVAAREKRQPLDLDLPERKIVLSEDGKVASVAFRDRLDAHRLIEEFMIEANVAAAEELIERRSALLFRVHEEPSPEKIAALREIAVNSGFTLAKGQVLHTRHLNALLAQAEGSPFDELINMSTLRAMTQAYYSPENYGHFGLSLRNYAHFTSPIRRYSDLIVHRALISAHRWPQGKRKDGLSAWDIEHLTETAQIISETERRSMAAERETTDRYLAAFLADRVGATFAGRIAGVARFGLFVKLDETGADGLVPIRTLGDEYFRHDPETQTLTGEKSGQTMGLGQRVLVKLASAEPVTGGLLLELLEVEDTPVARPKRSGKGRNTPRKPGAARVGKAKLQRKERRRR